MGDLSSQEPATPPGVSFPCRSHHHHQLMDSCSFPPHPPSQPSSSKELSSPMVPALTPDIPLQFSSVTFDSFSTPWTVACQASLSITNSQSLLKLMSIELVMPSTHLILCRRLFLLPSIFPSIRVFSKESVLHIRWPKCWSFSFSICPSKEYSGLISFRMDWLDLLADPHAVGLGLISFRPSCNCP